MRETGATATTGPDRFVSSVARGHTIVSLTTLTTSSSSARSSLWQHLFLPLALERLFAFSLNPVVNALRIRRLRDVPAVMVTVMTAAAMVADVSERMSPKTEDTTAMRVEVVEQAGLKAWLTDVTLPALTPAGKG